MNEKEKRDAALAYLKSLPDFPSTLLAASELSPQPAGWFEERWKSWRFRYHWLCFKLSEYLEDKVTALVCTIAKRKNNE